MPRAATTRPATPVSEPTVRADPALGADEEEDEPLDAVGEADSEPEEEGAPVAEPDSEAPEAEAEPEALGGS